LLAFQPIEPAYEGILAGVMVSLMNKERLRALYPSLDDKELQEASDNLEAYFAAVLRIALGTRSEDVDRSDHQVTMKERSNSSLENTSFEHG
jgi:hypothetical protein